MPLRSAEDRLCGATDCVAVTFTGVLVVGVDDPLQLIQVSEVWQRRRGLVVDIVIDQPDHVD